MPSNVIIMDEEIACRGQLQQLLKRFDKARHGLNQQVLENKDKQNYKSIEILLKGDVEEALKELDGVMSTKGTVTYLRLMKNIHHAFLDESISSLKRLP